MRLPTTRRAYDPTRKPRDWTPLQPAPALGAALGALSVAALFVIHQGTEWKTGLGLPVDLLLSLLLTSVATLLTCAAGALMLRALRLPWLPVAILVGVPTAMSGVLHIHCEAFRTDMLQGHLAVLVPVTLVMAGLGAAIGYRMWRGRGALPTLALLSSLALGGATLFWLASPGTPEPPYEWSAPGVEALALPDPAAPGPYRVRTLSYGSGTDKRAEYGEAASLKTPVVDGSPYLPGWSGYRGWLRTSYWGFDARQLPLHATV